LTILIKLVILDISIYSICEIAVCFLGTNSDDNIAQQIEEAEAKAPEDLTEEDKMALLGRPKNGDITRAQLRIKESKEFKVSAA
jgi:solute carrier family 8 (sodium/calcium exchanger)